MIGCWLFVVVVLLDCCCEFFFFVCDYRLILIGVWWLILVSDFDYGNEFGFVSSDLEVDLDVFVRVLWVFASSSFFFLFFFFAKITMASGYGWL